MHNKDYTASIQINSSPKETVIKIAEVSKWWAKGFEGKTKVGDEFKVFFKGGDWYKIKIENVIPDKKILWQVLDSDQSWHEKKNEWNGTKIIWEITSEGTGSKVSMTHLGLTPKFECYNQCKKGWDFLIKESLVKYLNEGTGLPV